MKPPPSISRVIASYPNWLIQRRNQDYFYYRSLGEMYRRFPLPFTIIDDHAYSFRTSFWYLGARLLRSAKKTASARLCMHRMRRTRLPRSYLDHSALYHSGFGLPSNAPGRIVFETEFYDFEDRGIPNPPDYTEEELQKVFRFGVRTHLSKQYFQKLYPSLSADKASVVPFFMPYLDHWEHTTPLKKPLSEGLTLIFVGNQARRKGLDLFLQMRAHLQNTVSVPVRAIIISNFQDGDAYDLNGCEVYRGLDSKAVAKYMAEAHYLVLLTRQDSHPKVMYEACAAGCGLIFSDIRPLKDIWNGSGFCIDLKATQAGFDAIARNAANEEIFRGFAQKNRARFSQEFSPSAALNAYRKLID